MSGLKAGIAGVILEDEVQRFSKKKIRRILKFKWHSVGISILSSPGTPRAELPDLAMYRHDLAPAIKVGQNE